MSLDGVEGLTGEMVENRDLRFEISELDACLRRHDKVGGEVITLRRKVEMKENEIEQNIVDARSGERKETPCEKWGKS